MTTREYFEIADTEAFLSLALLHARGVFGGAIQDPTYIECLTSIHQAVLDARNSHIRSIWFPDRSCAICADEPLMAGQTEQWHRLGHPRPA